MSFPTHRGRRLRRTPALRALACETRLSADQLIAPLFVCAGRGVREPIGSMPGHARLSVDLAVDEAVSLAALGVRSVLLFGIPSRKDASGTGAWDPEGPVPQAIRAIKAAAPSLTVWADVCMCEYTDHGHCGVLHGHGVDNDATLPLLARASVAYADAGADVIAPSDMMDGRVAAIRAALDAAGHVETVIVSYAVKYASAFYGPFREAAGSTPQFGDRRGYQMDPPNVREAIREAVADVEEGADMVMVKPGLPYLDVIRAVREHVNVPVVAYQVSGEYAMMHAAAERGWMDLNRAMWETTLGLRRGGADLVITYFARELASGLRDVATAATAAVPPAPGPDRQQPAASGQGPAPTPEPRATSDERAVPTGAR
jgi:porphobilinogen synthase